MKRATLAFVLVCLPVAVRAEVTWQRFLLDAGREATLPPALAAHDGAPDAVRPYFVFVQPGGSIPTSWWADLERSGVTVRHYVQRFAYQVEASPAAARSLRRLPFVRDVQEQRPGLKLDAKLYDWMTGAPEPDTALVLLSFFTEDARVRASGRLAALGIPVDRGDIGGSRALVIRPTKAQLALAVRLPETFFADRFYEATPENNLVGWKLESRASPTSIANNLGLTGMGQIAGVADSGCDTGAIPPGHVDFGNGTPYLGFGTKILAGYGWSTGIWSDLTNGHGTHVAGTLLGSGAGQPSNGYRYRGAAYNAQLVVQKVTSGGSIPSDLRNMFQQAQNAGAFLVNTSLNLGINGGAYDTRCYQVDDFTWSNRTFVHMKSAGNQGSGASTITSPAPAKNNIAAAAANNTTGAETLLNYSSRGPCTDQRWKPDIAAPGDLVTSVNAGTSAGYVGLGGTSMASPAAGSICILFREFYMTQRGWTPSNALLRATFASGARSLTGATYNRNQEGWGYAQLVNSLAPASPTYWWFEDEQVNLSTGNTQSYPFTVTDTTVPIRVTLAWTDPAASAGANPAYINNLNLEVDLPGGGTTYLGNVWPGPGGTADIRNNVEQVRIPVGAVTAGAYTARVVAQSVPQGPQNYAIHLRFGYIPTGTPTITFTASATRTPITPSVTRTSTATRTITNTFTITQTPSESRTFTVTATETRTATPTVTETATIAVPPVQPYPNPVLAGAAFRLSGLTVGTTISIFNAAGEQVLTAMHDDPLSDVLEILTQSGSGIPWAAGAYVVVLRPPDAEPIRTRLAVVR